MELSENQLIQYIMINCALCFQFLIFLFPKVEIRVFIAGPCSIIGSESDC